MRRLGVLTPLLVLSCIALVGCPQPVLSVSATSLHMTAGTDATFTVDNTGRNISRMSYTVTADEGITVSPTSGRLTGRAAPDTITVGITAGTTGTITVNAGTAGTETVTATTAQDYMTMSFDNAVDLAAEVANKTFTFTRQGNNTYKVTQANADFATHTSPTDATLGTAVGLTTAVSLYGQTYNQMTVLEDGAVELGNAAAAAAKTITAHFANPGVSGLRTDLDATATGASVQYEEMTDGVVVTYTDIPESGATATSTFQVVIYTNGNVELSYLNAVAESAVIGLSAGGGTPTDFVASDFSAAAATTPALKAAL
ncbi:MAG TPA: hypothetical protein HPP83_06505 [Candidatus Hydrogenedentes bacterium]|nr:hypothetical protein [Candidatus Hydrogenedentota bacterium]